MTNKQNVLDIIHSYFIEYAADLIPNNLPSVCDGLLPVHRKLIYSLNQAGMTHDKPFKKMLMASTEAMKYYIYGDASLTQSMKNAGSNFVLYKYLDPKGQYPDKNRRDGVGAAPRYIECRLSEYSEYLLQGIKYRNVPFTPNWDNSLEEPEFIPCPIPNMLINNSESIAVGFASKIPSHNLNEVCDAFIAYLQTGDIEKAIPYIKGVDSPLGANLIYDEAELRKILTTGRGSYQMVAEWHYDKKTNAITITEIPMSTVIEEIDDKIRLNIEKGKLKEIVDVHDNSGKDGLKYDIYLKRGADVETVVSKLRKYTPFQSSVPIYLYMIKPDGITPHLYNLEEMIKDWTAHRVSCIEKELAAQNEEMTLKRNRMKGLLQIATDIDKAHKIIKEAKNEKEAISELTKAFSLNNEQAEYVATIRMVNMNKEWIAKQTKEYDVLAKKIETNKKIIASEAKIKNVIIQQLEEAKKLYGMERKTRILYDMDKAVKVDIIDDFNCTVVCTEQGYVKKLTRYSENQKVKDGDRIMTVAQTTNKSNLLVFTNKANMYTVKISSLEEGVSSSLGQYLPSMLSLESDEEIICVIPTTDYSGNILLCFDNGKVGRVSLSAYKTSLKKMTKAFNTDYDLAAMYAESEYPYVLMESSSRKRVVYDIKTIRVQASRTTRGVQVIKLKEEEVVDVVGYGFSEDWVPYLIGSAGAGKKVK